MFWKKRKEAPVKYETPQIGPKTLAFTTYRITTPTPTTVKLVYGTAIPALANLLPEPLLAESCDYPLVEMENVHGYRAYRVLPNGYLVAPTKDDLVTTRLTALATCDQGKSHRPPQTGCCGYYALYEKANAVRGYYKQGSVIAKVSAVGETIVCREGFQSVQLRIDELYYQGQSEDLCRVLSERYEIPVFEEELCKSETPSSGSTPSLQMMQAEYLRRLFNQGMPSPRPTPPPSGSPSRYAPGFASGGPLLP